MSSELYLSLTRKTSVVVERVGPRRYRMHLKSGAFTSHYKYAWGTRKHAQRKADGWLRSHIKSTVDAADRDARHSEVWTVLPKP